MKREHASKVSVGLIGAVLLVATGCGRRSQGGSSQHLGETLKASDLARVTETVTDIQPAEPAQITDQITAGTLMLRAEQFTNPNQAPITIWIQASDSVSVWGMCNEDGAQYRSSLSAPTLASHENQLELEEDPNGWVSFEVAAGGSATIQWLAGGSFSWIPGPNPARSGAPCNQSQPKRGWSQFDLTGGISEQVRVTPTGVEAAEATGDARNAEPGRVWILPNTQDSLNLRCAG